MEPEEMAKNVDACYKNILEKFNPGARQLINAGKSYLKSLHGAAAAAKVYLESLSRVAKQAQQGTCGGTADIGLALQQMIDVQREIQAQQLNTLKAFYVDLLVPLESNIEKDTKVVQMDQKKFNQQYRNQFEIYSKAVGLVKKHGKRSAAKNNRSSASYDKEIKHLQTMDEEKSKLDALCEISLRDAIIQERKRYGFVLERQTSLAKHWLAHYGKGAALLEKHLDGWQETSKAREAIPSNVDFLLDSQHMGQSNQPLDDNLYALPRTPEMMLSEEADHFSVVSHLRKSHSVDASYLDDDESLHEAVNPKMCALGPILGNDKANGGINKSKSEFNLAFKCADRANARAEAGGICAPRPKSMALTSSGSKGTVRALYAYLSSGEHQMSFLEGDLITLLGDESIAFHGDRNKGWNYGENQRTGKRGWFPLAYTEPVKDTDVDSGLGLRSQLDSSYVIGGSGNNNVAATTTTINNNDCESTSSGNSSASNSSSSGAGCATLTLKSRKAPLGSTTCTASNTLRPISLIGDRAFFNKVYGFGKLRKSRSGFSERPLFPASTPTLPEAADFPGAAAGTASAVAPALINNNNISHSSSSNNIPTILSPCKQTPPAPPPRSACPLAGVSGTETLVAPSAAAGSDLSLRSNSQDSGFVNGETNSSATLRLTAPTLAPPPAAPEIDYSDEDVRPPIRSSLGDWYKTDAPLETSETVTMTLDRNPKNSSASESHGDGYPPVLGYLATLTRSKMSHTLKWSDQQHRNVRSVGGIFAKNRIAFNPSLTTSAKVRTKSTTGILKNALRRSRDSGLDELGPDCNASSVNLWQHKSSVPVYVGWRPPMPLPKESGESGRKRAMTSVRIRTNLSRKKSFSESDLLEADNSEYSVIDPVNRLPLLPSLPPTLPFLTPVLERLEDETKQLPKPHTLPRQKVAPVARVQFSLEHGTPGASSKLVEATNQVMNTSMTSSITSSVTSSTFTDYSLQLRKRLQSPEGGSNLDDISETTGNRCGPWYDLWPPIGYPSTSDNASNFRFCEIAQL